MTFLTKESRIMEAHHPRENPWCTLSPDDRLKIVYHIYTDARPDSKQRSSYTLASEPKLNLVFVHGAGMSKEGWDDMIERFYDNTPHPLGKVISLDVANHGESYRQNEGKLGWAYPWSDGGRDIAKLIRDEIDIGSGPTIVISHSMGSTQSIYAAFFAPAEIDAVVVVDPVLYIPEEIRTEPVGIEFMSKRMGKIRRGIQEKFSSWEEYEDYIRNKYFSKTFDPKVLDSFIQNSVFKDEKDGKWTFITGAEHNMLSYFNSLYTSLGQKSLKVLSMLDCPVMHIAGTESAFNSPEAIPKNREYLPEGSEIADIPGGGHLVPFEYPKETFEALYPFVIKHYSRANDRRAEFENRKSMTEGERQELFAEKYGEVARTYPVNKLYSKL